MLKLDQVKLAIVGLGYVGLPLAVEFGKKYPVIGFDINAKRVAELTPICPGSHPRGGAGRAQ